MWTADRQTLLCSAKAAGFPIAAYLGAVLVLGMGAAALLDRTVATVVTADVAYSHAQAPQPAERRYSVVLNDDFVDKIKSQKFWSDKKASKGGGQPQPAFFGGSPRGGQGFLNALFGPGRPGRGRGDESRTDGGDWYRGDGDTYTTVCVRLCDGSYTPVSFSTTNDNFDRDEQACKSSCQAPTRLFVYRNPSRGIEDMADVRGQPYSKLTTAFLFRTKYDPSCKCKPHPWEQQALDRHRSYALQEQVRKGNRQAAVELKQVIARMNAPQPVTDRRAANGRADILVTGALAPLAADAGKPEAIITPTLGVVAPGKPDPSRADPQPAPVQRPVTTAPAPKPQRAAQVYNGDGGRMRLGAAGGQTRSEPQRSSDRGGSDWKRRVSESSR